MIAPSDRLPIRGGTLIDGNGAENLIDCGRIMAGAIVGKARPR